MRRRYVWLAVLAACSLWGTLMIVPASAQLLEADAELDENSPNRNRGDEATLNVRSWIAGDFRTLVRFDLSGIPASTPIDSATLELCLDRISGDKSTRTYGVHRVTKSWVENQVTANQASDGVPWDNFFGDFDSNPTDIVGIDKDVLTNDPNVFISWDVTADVQDFVDGILVNNGWLIKDESENKSALYRTDWVSRESISEPCIGASAPRLTVVTP